MEERIEEKFQTRSQKGCFKLVCEGFIYRQSFGLAPRAVPRCTLERAVHMDAYKYPESRELLVNAIQI